MRLILFDIDGTLILSGGAGMRAFYRAFGDVFGIAVAREVVRPDGKTDPLIAREILEHFGREREWNEASRDALFDAYLAHLAGEMSRARADSTLRVLPGVLQLLGTLAVRSDAALGIVTGNLEAGARMKLENAGLNGYFRFGGYGSDSEDRTELIRIAIERGARAISPARPDGAFVIGDTPLDIIHGHAAGARVIAVASARYSPEDLQAHTPDLLVPDLTRTAEILAFLENPDS